MIKQIPLQRIGRFTYMEKKLRKVKPEESGHCNMPNRRSQENSQKKLDAKSSLGVETNPRQTGLKGTGPNNPGTFKPVPQECLQEQVHTFERGIIICTK